MGIENLLLGVLSGLSGYTKGRREHKQRDKDDAADEAEIAWREELKGQQRVDWQNKNREDKEEPIKKEFESLSNQAATFAKAGEYETALETVQKANALAEPDPNTGRRFLTPLDPKLFGPSRKGIDAEFQERALNANPDDPAAGGGVAWKALRARYSEAQLRKLYPEFDELEKSVDGQGEPSELYGTTGAPDAQGNPTLPQGAPPPEPEAQQPVPYASDTNRMLDQATAAPAQQMGASQLMTQFGQKQMAVEAATSGPAPVPMTPKQPRLKYPPAIATLFKRGETRATRADVVSSVIRNNTYGGTPENAAAIAKVSDPGYQPTPEDWAATVPTANRELIESKTDKNRESIEMSTLKRMMIPVESRRKMKELEFKIRDAAIRRNYDQTYKSNVLSLQRERLKWSQIIGKAAMDDSDERLRVSKGRLSGYYKNLASYNEPGTERYDELDDIADELSSETGWDGKPNEAQRGGGTPVAIPKGPKRKASVAPRGNQRALPSKKSSETDHDYVARVVGNDPRLKGMYNNYSGSEDRVTHYAKKFKEWGL